MGGSRHKEKIESLETKKERHSDTDDGNLICYQCGSVITNRSERIAIHGSASHTFANPAGIVFEIECFKTATGCDISGRATGEFTWFSGYDWQVAFCTSCSTHMGWRFISNSGQTFFALIADRLLDSKQTTS